MISSLFSSFLLFFLPLLPVRFSLFTWALSYFFSRCSTIQFSRFARAFSPAVCYWYSAYICIRALSCSFSRCLSLIFRQRTDKTDFVLKLSSKFGHAVSRHRNAGWELRVWATDLSKNSPYGSAPTCKLAHERVNWSITFDFGLHDGVDVRTVGRTDGRSYDDVITKISRMDGLPYFLTNGAPRARAFGARGAPL